MHIKFVLKCDNDECENYKLFVNEAVFLDDISADLFQSNYGNGSEDPDDYCPFCGKLASMEDEIEEYYDRDSVRI